MPSAAAELERLPTRTKAYAADALEHPDESYADIARRHGVTRQAVRNLLSDVTVQQLIRRARRQQLDKALGLKQKALLVAESITLESLEQYDTAQKIVLLERMAAAADKLPQPTTEQLTERDRTAFLHTCRHWLLLGWRLARRGLDRQRLLQQAERKLARRYPATPG